jgi:hypothetical protein
MHQAPPNKTSVLAEAQPPQVDSDGFLQSQQFPFNGTITPLPEYIAWKWGNGSGAPGQGQHQVPVGSYRGRIGLTPGLNRTGVPWAHPSNITFSNGSTIPFPDKFAWIFNESSGEGVPWGQVIGAGVAFGANGTARPGWLANATVSNDTLRLRQKQRGAAEDKRMLSQFRNGTAYARLPPQWPENFTVNGTVPGLPEHFKGSVQSNATFYGNQQGVGGRPQRGLVKNTTMPLVWGGNATGGANQAGSVVPVPADLLRRGNSSFQLIQGPQPQGPGGVPFRLQRGFNGTVPGLPSQTGPNRSEADAGHWNATAGMMLQTRKGSMLPSRGPFVNVGSTGTAGLPAFFVNGSAGAASTLLLPENTNPAGTVKPEGKLLYGGSLHMGLQVPSGRSLLKDAGEGAPAAASGRSEQQEKNERESEKVRLRGQLLGTEDDD